ncbi:MAG: SGNH/GDSL hydrolase family protein [Nocardioides sp.]
MVSRGVASTGSRWSSRRGVVVLGAALVVAVVSLLFVRVADGARADGDRCELFTADSRERAAQVTGSGERVVVIGDSWSVGLGLDRPVASWPSRLEGSVHVAGFSGSGFSPGASECRAVSFADRAPEALRGRPELVVVEGGLNDYDQSRTDIRAGFERLMVALDGHRVAIVGPATAPSRAAAVPQVDRLLARLAADADVAYVRTSDLELSYLDDRLHLTPAGHEAFGDFVAARLVALGLG